MADAKAEFMKKMGKYKKAYKEARTVDASGFSQAELKDGAYEAKLTGVNMGAMKDETPYVSLNFLVTTGVGKGERPSIFHAIKNEDSLTYLVKDCKRLGIEADEMEMEEMFEALIELAKEKPLVKIDVKNNSFKNKKTKKTETRLNVYVNKLLQGSEEVEDEDEDEEEEDDTDNTEEDSEDEEDSDDNNDGDEDESEDDEDEEEEEDDEPADPEKGNLVKYKAKGSRKATEFTVTKVNAKAKTVDLKNDDGKTFKGIPFADVELVFDED